MTAITIICFILSVIIYIVGGFVCGRICAEIIRDKNKKMNEVMWFWAGFLFNVIAVFMTLTVKKENE